MSARNLGIISLISHVIPRKQIRICNKETVQQIPKIIQIIRHLMFCHVNSCILTFVLLQFTNVFLSVFDFSLICPDSSLIILKYLNSLRGFLFQDDRKAIYFCAKDFRNPQNPIYFRRKNSKVVENLENSHNYYSA